jgi:CRISPR/Cas system CSM-associated protein Csm3 (group 7 of RAMP superfamily)
MTDFRIGSADQINLYTDLPVLRWSQTQDGLPYIPGSSLRGVMRGHLERERGLLGCSEEVLLSLFGYAGDNREDNSTTYRGRLRVYDSIPNLIGAGVAWTNYEIRDHVKIDRDTGASEDKAKFDAERVSRHTRLEFPFHLIYEGEASDDEELVLLGEALRALKHEELTIGGRAAIGCGRFRLKSTGYWAFDRTQPQGMLEFLRYRLDSSIVPATSTFDFPKPKNGPISEPVQGAFHRLTVELEIHGNGPLLVKAASLPVDEQAKRKNAAMEAAKNAPEAAKENAKLKIPTDSTYVTTVGTAADGALTQMPYFPGSSLRGVLRQRAEHICTAQKLGDGTPMRLFGTEKGMAGGRRGLLRIEDGVINQHRPVRSDHVAVDRITHAAAGGAKFDTESLDSPRIQFRLNIDFTNDFEDLISAALLLVLIQDLTTEGSGIALGSRTTRGYGSIYPATIISIYGSFHGHMAKVIQDFSIEASDRPGRTAFGAAQSTPSILFKALCDGLDEYWQRARLRAIMA